MRYDARESALNEDIYFKEKNHEYRTYDVNYFLPEPYISLLECDGGIDHNMNFVSNQVSLFGLFFVGNTDKLILIRGCPGLS